ncbi:hypothetical protein [Myxococcus xanthus]|uniref:hypothetical protein n=1 Tax=Myxococcus xanthus TaxID=34 RepID=UPI001F1ACFE4|nr:hypothetical protein [Myxococcus xanthus]
MPAFRVPRIRPETIKDAYRRVVNMDIRGMLLGGGPVEDLPEPVQKFIDDVMLPTCIVLVNAIEEDWQNLQAVFSEEG